VYVEFLTFLCCRMLKLDATVDLFISCNSELPLVVRLVLKSRCIFMLCDINSLHE